MLLSPSPFRSRSAIRSRNTSSSSCPLRGRYGTALRGAGKSKKDPIPLPLEGVSEDARARRTSALADLLQAADAGVFDYDRLADLDQ